MNETGKLSLYWLLVYIRVKSWPPEVSAKTALDFSGAKISPQVSI